MSPQERDLVALLGATAGDSRALAELYDRYAHLMHSVSTSVLSGNGGADDAVRDAFRLVWTRMAVYDPRCGSVGTWLAILARDCALDRLRQRPKHTEAEKLVGPGLDRPRPRPEPRDPASRRAHDALAALPPMERQALEAAFFRGMGWPDIARDLEVPAATVRRWVVQSLVRLREAAEVEERV